MPSRRTVLAVLAAALVLPAAGAPARAAEADGPQAFLAGIYGRVAKARKASTPLPWDRPEGRGTVFSAAVVDLWAKAESKATADGDIGPVDFDVFTNSQDSGPIDPKFTVTGEEAATANVRVALRTPKGGGEPKPDDVLVFNLIKGPQGWRIDDIHGSVSGDRWNLRGLLTLQ